MSIAASQIPAIKTDNVSQALATAARETGVDFDYLLTTAKRESSLNPLAKSKTSSATGLFQFIDQTWLATVKNYGDKHGLGAQAAAIEVDASGKYRVADSADRAAILALRKDPEAAALMAGELTNESRRSLEAGLGRPADSSELYMAHFLGASGAVDFLKSADTNPNAIAADQFGRAAASNKSVFYRPDGTGRTMSEVKSHLTALHTQGPSMSSPETGGTQRALTGGGAGQIGMIANGAFGGVSPALKLTPQVLQILASLDPIPGSNREGSDSYRALLRQPRDAA